VLRVFGECRGKRKKGTALGLLSYGHKSSDTDTRTVQLYATPAVNSALLSLYSRLVQWHCVLLYLKKTQIKIGAKSNYLCLVVSLLFWSSFSCKMWPITNFVTAASRSVLMSIGAGVALSIYRFCVLFGFATNKYNSIRVGRSVSRSAGRPEHSKLAENNPPLLYLTICCNTPAPCHVFIDSGRYRTNKKSNHITPWILKLNEISYLRWNLKVHYHVQRTPPLDNTMSQLEPNYSFTQHLCDTVACGVLRLA
jgi:hypothetical protein